MLDCSSRDAAEHGSALPKNEKQSSMARLYKERTAVKQPRRYNWIQVALISLYLSKACSDLSRPLPDCL